MKIQILFIAMVIFAGCRPPASSSELQSTGGNNTQTVKPTATTSPEKLAGAAVGPSEMQKKVSDCLAKKMFYDRQSSASDKCTSMPVAAVPCELPSATNGTNNIKSIMSAAQAASVDGYLADENVLKNYIIDQCLDCSSDAAKGFAACRVAGVAASAKIVKIYFVKQVNTEILIKTLDVVR